MATTFFFRAVASDGKPRTGTLTAENDKLVANELRRQGLIPVYIGLSKKKSGGFVATLLDPPHEFRPFLLIRLTHLRDHSPGIQT